MKVDDFVEDIGDVLQEDFETSPVWTKVEVFGYVRQALKTFCQLTQLIDKHENRLVNATTGEATVPEDFEQSYFVQFSQLMQDVVVTDELDFVEDGWLSGTKGTPKGASIIGSGSGSVIRLAPVPSSVYDGGATGSAHATLTLYDGADYWIVRTLSGIIQTLNVGSAPATAPVIEGPTTYWDLSITTAGLLVTTASASTTPDAVGLQDANVSLKWWQLTSTDSGELITTPEYENIGLGVGALIDNTNWQDFNSEYGVIVDTYADASATTPSDISKVNRPVGLSLFGRTGTESATVWYKGSHEDLGSLDSEIWLSDGLMPILKHGVLALAFGHDGDGHDKQKSELLKNVFFAECTSIRGIFESRWE